MSDDFPHHPVFDEPPPDGMGQRYLRLYWMLLDSIPSSVLLLDRQLRILSVNRNFLQKARLSEAKVIGQQLESVLPAAICEHMQARTRVAKIFRTAEAVKGERLVYRAPGLPSRMYVYSLLPFSWEDKVECVLLLMEDVTDKVRLSEEAQRAERHLASVVESASDIVLSMDIKGRVLTWNTAAARITGFEECDVQGRQLGDLCPKEQRASLIQILRQALSPGAGSLGAEPVEVALLHCDKGIVPISWVFSAMRDADNRVVGLVAVGRDLTERRKFEAQLVQSEKLASLGVMAGGIAHEIRNPLAVVSSAAQLLLHRNLTPELQRECCERILPNVQRVAVIIENLLRFARPSDKGSVHPVNLVGAVQEAASLVANQIRLAKIELHTSYPDQPVIVLGNLALLQQVITNLLLNAINAMIAKGGRIQLLVETDRPAGKNALVRVIDTGPGISSTHLPKVFDPFFTTMPVGQGTGLGLSISYAIVKHHGGKIDISSSAESGTEVRVEIPLEDEEEKP